MGYAEVGTVCALKHRLAAGVRFEAQISKRLACVSRQDLTQNRPRNNEFPQILYKAIARGDLGFFRREQIPAGTERRAFHLEPDPPKMDFARRQMKFVPRGAPRPQRLTRGSAQAHRQRSDNREPW